MGCSAATGFEFALSLAAECQTLSNRTWAREKTFLVKYLKRFFLTRGLGIIRVEQDSTDPDNLTSQA